MLILCLTGALIAPHLIDWDSRRDAIAAQLSKTIGEPVRINGPIGLELLPTPSLKLSIVEIGGNGPVRMSVGRFKLHMAIPPLLRGEIRITDAVLHSARILVQPKRIAVTTPPIQPDRQDLPRIGFDRLNIVDGEIELLDASGASTMTFKRIDGSFEVSTLTGPYRGNLHFDSDNQRRNLRFSTGQIGADGLRIKALSENESAAARSEFDGDIQIVDGQLSISGQIAGSGNAAIPVGTGYAQVIWRAGGKLAFRGNAGKLDKIEIGLGNGDRQIVLTGMADIAIANTVSVRAALAGKQADLDRLLAGEDGKRTSTPLLLLQHAKGDGRGFSKPDWLQGELDLSFASLMLGGEAIMTPRVVVAVGAKELPVLRSAEAVLPGQTRVQIFPVQGADGTDETARLQVTSGDIARLNGWFHGRPSRAQAIRQLKMDGVMQVLDTGIGLRDAKVQADDMVMSGAIRLEQMQSGPKLTLNLEADQLDIAKLPDMGDAEGRSDIDLDMTVNARRVRYLGIGAGSIVGRLRRTGNSLMIDQLDITDVGGANVQATGAFSPDYQDFQLKLEATQLAALTELADKFLPQAHAQHLRRRAPLLAPARISLKATTALDKGAREQTIHIAGTLADTGIDARLRLQPDGQLAGADGLSVDLTSPRVAHFIQQIGLETIPLAGAGGARLNLRGNGLVPGAAGATWSMAGNLGNLTVELSGQQTRDATQPFEGTLALHSRDLAPLAQTLLVTVPTIPVGMPFDLKAGLDLRGYKITLREVNMNAGGTQVTGEIAFNLAEFGRIAGQLKTGSLDAASLAPLIFGTAQQPLPNDIWSKEGFAPAAAMTLPGDLWIKADKVGLIGNIVLEKPTFVVRFENGIIYLEHVAARWNGNPLSGQATLRRNGPTVNLAGRMTLDQMQISQLPGSDVNGSGSSQLTFSAIGDSPYAVIGALAGAGRMDIRQAEVRSLDSGALDSVIARQQSAPDAVTGEQLARTLLDRLTGRVPLSAIQLPINLAGGVLRAGPLSLLSKDEDIRGNVALDLRTLAVTGEVDHIARQAPKGWSGPNPRARLTWKGPLGQVQPSIDTTALANGLTAIAIQRETERIDALEQDQRERTQFNRRLRAAEDERRAQETAQRVLIEEQRRQAAAKTEAARQELLKQETLKQETLRQRIDEVIRSAPPSTTGTSSQPLVITPPAARP